MSIVLLSAGLDSTVNFYQAMRVGTVKMVLTFNYGQRAAKREIQRAQELCHMNSVLHKVVDVQWFRDFTFTSLVNTHQQIPVDMKIDNLKDCEDTAQRVWVPNRNGIMINIAAGFAEGLGAKKVIVGFNIEEAATFPDNSVDYIKAVNCGLSYSTMRKIEVECYTQSMNKIEIVCLGKSLGVPFDKIWSCYFDQENPCGHCESCLRFERAMKES